MTAQAQKRRPAEGAGRRNDDFQGEVSGYSEGGRKANAPPPWFRFDVAKWRGMTVDLKPTERGILIDLLVQIHQRGEPIPNDPCRLARACGTTRAAFERALAMFLADGRIVRQAGGLWSLYIEAELDNCEKRSKAAREKASKRWEKSQENQRPCDAVAYRRKDGEIVEREPPTGVPPSGSPDTESVSTNDPDARKRAPDQDQKKLKIGQQVEVVSIGPVTITALGRKTVKAEDGERSARIARFRSDRGIDFLGGVYAIDGREAIGKDTVRRRDEIPPKHLNDILWDQSKNSDRERTDAA